MSDLKTQNVLRGGMTLEDFRENYGIRTHEKEDLVLFSYDDLHPDCDRFGPITRECRGLVLQKDTWDLVALPMFRFFNYGERKSEAFRWCNAQAFEKLDGTMITLFWHRDRWRIATRATIDATGSLPDPCPEKGMRTFEDAVWPLFFGKLNRPDLIDHDFTYVFEFVSPWNRVVRFYDEPGMYLLTARCIAPEHLHIEVSDELSDKMAHECGFLRPRKVSIDSVPDVEDLLASLTDPTEEGFVVKDLWERRLKMKSEQYKQTHKTINNGRPRYWEMILEYSDGEALKLFPKYQEEYRRLKKGFNDVFVWSDETFKAFLEQTLKECGNAHGRKFFATLACGHPMEWFLWRLWNGQFATSRRAYNSMKPEKKKNFLKEKLPRLIEQMKAGQ